MNPTLIYATTIVTLVGGVIGIWVWVRPAFKRSRAVADAILGEEAVSDRAGKEIQPARPGLVSRVGSVEHAVALLVETNTRLDDHEGRLNGHEEQIKELKEQVIERIAAKAEAVSAWRAVEAVAKNADPTAPEIEP